MIMLLMKLFIGALVYYVMVMVVPQIKIKQKAIRLFGKYFTYFIGGWDVTSFILMAIVLCGIFMGNMFRDVMITISGVIFCTAVFLGLFVTLIFGVYCFDDKFFYIISFPKGVRKVSLDEIREASKYIYPFLANAMVIFLTKDKFFCIPMGAYVGGYCFIEKFFEKLGLTPIDMHPELLWKNEYMKITSDETKALLKKITKSRKRV